MIINVKTSSNNYDVIIYKDSLKDAKKYFNLSKKTLIVTDNGIPLEYVNELKKQCLNPFVFTINQGEISKNIENYQAIIKFMLENDFTRKDVIVALGGGVVGDLSGFVAATFMRGIKFYNIPTTLLAQIDSSIGGKTAIDFNNIKNVVGAFYPPTCVLIDPNTLKTLNTRQLHAGLVEAIKMSLTSSFQLYNKIKNSTFLEDDLENIICESLMIKKMIVEEDEKEKGLRKILNFGHSIGHAIESYSSLSLLHGECVGLGMLYMVDDKIKKDLKEVLEKYELPVEVSIDVKKIISFIKHDKKADGNKIDIIYVDNIGSYQIKTIKIDDLRKYIGG